MSSRSPLSLFEYEHTCAVTQSSVDYSFTINIKASGLMSQSCVFGVHGVLRVLVSWRQTSEGKAIELFFHPSQTTAFSSRHVPDCQNSKKDTNNVQIIIDQI